MNCLYETSKQKKGKCKLSNKTFQQGDLKIGVRSHTATSYYNMDSIGSVLRRIVSLTTTSSFQLTMDQIKGNEKLTCVDRDKLETMLKKLYESKEGGGDEMKNTSKPSEALSSPGASCYTSNNDDHETAKPKHDKKSKKQEQPKVGTKSGTKGKVMWKFGGRSCYGTLLPSKETKTHCYARTHKGNIKTLAKGKDYWSILG